MFDASITHTVSSSGYAAIFVLMALESALIPIPSEVTMPFGGYLAAKGDLGLGLVVMAGALGNVVGSLLAYVIGRRYGHAWLLRVPFIREKEIRQAESWFHRYGYMASFIGRFVPGVRTYISLPAGLGKVKVVPFTLLTFLGVLIWAWALALVGYYLGSSWDKVTSYFGAVNIVIAALLAALVGWWLWHRRRRKKRI